MAAPVLKINLDLQILQWNCRGIKNLSELRSLLSDKDIAPQIFCLQETWLSDKKNPPKIPNYSEPIMKNRKEIRRRRSPIYVKNDIPFKAVDIDFIFCELEACGISVFLRNEKLSIINLYDPDFQSFRVNDFENLFHQLNTKNYIITGDFNAHDPLWDNSARDAKGKDLSHLINNYNLTILNDGTPTMANFTTAPDLTLATPEMSLHTTWNPINQSCGSDHLPILISLVLSTVPRGRPISPDGN